MEFLRDVWDFVRTIDSPYIAALDILLVAYIFYRLLLLVRGTRATQLLRGVVIILALYWITTPLPTFNWLIRQMLLPGIIAVVIIFQPELRIALARLGRGRLLGGRLTLFGQQDYTDVINTVVDAAGELAEERNGALIVLERDVGLEDVIRTGKRIDGRVSTELLRSIFFPNSTLHDGAVVVCNDQIVAAGCVLPHSDSPSPAGPSGLRHRAALGLAERTDAAVIVVSEETGRISLAANGQLTPALGRAELSERLLKLFAAPRSGRRWLFWQV
ncbi:MAG: diadenylate cyclase CdaA [Armatimonadota bacterium]